MIIQTQILDIYDDESIEMPLNNLICWIKPVHAQTEIPTGDAFVTTVLSLVSVAVY